jgi:hypothetical protein
MSPATPMPPNAKDFAAARSRTGAFSDAAASETPDCARITPAASLRTSIFTSQNSAALIHLTRIRRTFTFKGEDFFVEELDYQQEQEHEQEKTSERSTPINREQAPNAQRLIRTSGYKLSRAGWRSSVPEFAALRPGSVSSRCRRGLRPVISWCRRACPPPSRYSSCRRNRRYY